MNLIRDFLERAINAQSVADDDILWAKVDLVPLECEISERLLDVTIRDNLDGPGRVKAYRIQLQELT